MLSAVLLAASCLSDDNDYDFTYNGDTAITSFSLGKLKRVVYTKAKSTFDDQGNPADSSYTAEVDGSVYKFSIDQFGGNIYNTDSLPKGTDKTKVLCTVNTKKGGIVLIKNADSDTLQYFNSTDSTDFASARELRVYTIDGSAYRRYEVSVNVHNELPDSFAWRDRGNQAAFATAKDMRAAAVGNSMFVLTTDGASTTLHATAITDGAAWSEANGTALLDADAYRNTAVKDDKLFIISGGRLHTISDGGTVTANDMGGTDIPQQLAGAGKAKLYGLTADGRITASDDNGLTWTADEITDNDEKQYIPTACISARSVATATDNTAERIILTGIRNLDTYPGDSTAMIWNKLEEHAQGSDSHKWIMLNEDNNSRLPSLANLQTANYGTKIIALGGKGQGGSTAKGFNGIYSSADNGLTWHTDKLFVLPEGFDNAASNTFAITADKENCLWIICGSNGKVWRGRLNKLGWKETNSSFTE